MFDISIERLWMFLFSELAQREIENLQAVEVLEVKYYSFH